MANIFSIPGTAAACIVGEDWFVMSVNSKAPPSSDTTFLGHDRTGKNMPKRVIGCSLYATAQQTAVGIVEDG